MEIIELRLRTACLSKLRDFYAGVLAWPAAEETPDSLVLAAGNTRLVFEQRDDSEDEEPFIYHFAFNIPENQFAEAKAWLKARTPLTMHGERDEIHWSAWNAHAVYFTDPAGNVGEFIARHNLPNTSETPFSTASIREVSEIGLAVEKVGEACDELKETLGIGVWDQGDGEIFRAMGDEHGIFIVVRRGRPWFPTSDARAELIPLTVILRGRTRQAYSLPGTPYTIEVRPG